MTWFASFNTKLVHLLIENNRSQDQGSGFSGSGFKMITDSLYSYSRRIKKRNKICFSDLLDCIIHVQALVHKIKLCQRSPFPFAMNSVIVKHSKIKKRTVLLQNITDNLDIKSMHVL